VAVALSKHFQVSLWYCFEKQGVLENIEDDHSVIENINPKKYALLKATHAIHSGMIPKMDNCFEALKKGVSKVKIGAPPMILGKTKHTTLTLADE
jgi:acetylglutamate kinase